MIEIQLWYQKFEQKYEINVKYLSINTGWISESDEQETTDDKYDE